MFDINDPTKEACSRKKLPMSPEELAKYRPQPVATSTTHPTAKQIAYQAGVSALESIVLRLEAVEREIAELKKI